MTAPAFDQLNRRIVRCRRCPRLREYCADVAREKRKAYRDWDYWGRPVPNLGDPAARVLIVGLAPGAHGANRTGRMFTGDRSGDFLFDALHRTGFASQPEATHRDDGLELRGIQITAAAHCAPPGNKPARDELDHCFGHLIDTARSLPDLRVLIALGGIAFDACLKLYHTFDWAPVRPKPKFGHGVAHTFDEHAGAPVLMGSYHPSQQNTFTGRLTMDMLVDVFRAARGHAGLD